MRNLIFILVSLPILTNAQDYIVTTQYDTLQGEITILQPEEYNESIILKTDKSKENYKSHQLIGFLHDNNIYKTVEYQNKYYFMKLVSDGFLSMYLFRLDESHAFGTRFLLKYTLEGMELPNLLFKQHMANFVSECPELSNKIREKEYKKKDITEIITAYNSCIANQQTESKNSTQVNPTSVVLINEIVNEITDQELKLLLTDIKAKLQNNESIPKYMISALESHNYTSDKKSELVKLLNSNN